MPRLCFKKKFFSAILQGQKTTTIRRWKTCKLTAGDKAYSPGIGWIRVASCQKIRLGKLKAADARADGFNTLAELHRTVSHFYPDYRNDGKNWYRIEFTLCRRRARSQIAGKKALNPLGQVARSLLAQHIRAKLDKAVQQSRSLAPYEQRGYFAASRP
ncbi:MAG: ASCH domain-containing protein [Planctomycetota bacterium]|nr:ASCH domain-containing protein [Planctomycetota bacterium]